MPLDTDQTDSPAPTLRLDQPIPAFEARTTQGEISSIDYLGKWLILFSHPANFTPVCTSEFIAMQQSIEEFNDLNCNILGLSVDSIYSHIAWIRSIKNDFGVEITFPIIEDISMSIARAFGMIHNDSAGTATVRSVFFIDDKGVLRALIHYPMNVGRSISEIIRTLSALQASDSSHLSAPEGWQPGDEMVLTPPTSSFQADSVVASQSSPGQSWYYSKIPEQA